jgi:O-antigen ligase
MAWSHRYLGAVEAVRWFLFALLVWLGLNTLTRERLQWLAWAVHAGALAASAWAALQFWLALDLFPQGPNPGSTFINRNFFAEFVVCTLPFGALLLARARKSAAVVGLAASLGFVVTTILMTGTRAALIALWLQLFVVLPLIAWRCREQLAWKGWSRRLLLSMLAAFVGTVLVLGMVPTGNMKILGEERGATALQRGINRTQSIGPRDGSLGIRMVMWRATLNAIQARPLTGLGAGAWENEIPRYQAVGSQLETDYYAHNEFLQVVAEYGLAGWLFLWLLGAYLLLAAGRTWRADSAEAHEDQPWRAVLLSSLLALMVVSNIGFPWRMATTGALFALCLGGLAASDARIGLRARLLARPLQWNPLRANAALAATTACIVLALFIVERAAEAESKLVRAAKMAIGISLSGSPNNPQFDASKREMLRLVSEGIAINPHYRKITPIVADELARWGDWRNATWIWESVLASRPYIVAIISNAARGHASLGQTGQALELLERARQIQPSAPSVRSLEVVLLSRAGQEPKALELAKDAVGSGIYDYDLVNALFMLARRAGDYPLAEKAAALRMAQWPESRAAGQVQLGLMYGVDMRQEDKALAAFRLGLQLASPTQRAGLLQQIPPEFRARLGAAASTPAGGTQTSASSK